MLPPGYWYARYAADWVIAGKPSFPPDIPAITTVPDKTKDRDQYYAYAYYRTLAVEFTRITLGNAFSDKIFDIQVDGYNGTYSLQDLFPVLNNDGKITAPLLYPNYQRTWDARQEANGVKVKSDFGEAALGALGGAYFEKQARMQYDVDKTESPVEVVSFGHTHIPEFYSTSREGSTSTPAPGSTTTPTTRKAMVRCSPAPSPSSRRERRTRWMSTNTRRRKPQGHQGDAPHRPSLKHKPLHGAEPSGSARFFSSPPVV
jgi:hypothetical protein